MEQPQAPMQSEQGRISQANLAPRTWWQRWWWLILVGPAIAFLDAVAYVIGTEQGKIGITLVTAGLIIVTLVVGKFLWSRGATGKALTIVAWIVTPFFLYPTIVFWVLHGGNVVNISRQTHSARQESLLSSAERLSCPASFNDTTTTCIQPMDIIQAVQSAPPPTPEELRLGIKTEVQYVAQVQEAFPGSFTWPPNTFSSGSETQPVFLGMEGLLLNQEQCQQLVGNHPTTVAMWINLAHDCPLCGDGYTAERRIFFTSDNRPVCQALYSLANWISIVPSHRS